MTKQKAVIDALEAENTELQHRITALEWELRGWQVACDANQARITKLDGSLREIAKGKSWASNGFDLDGEFRLSRKAMMASARRTLGSV